MATLSNGVISHKDWGWHEEIIYSWGDVDRHMVISGSEQSSFPRELFRAEGAGSTEIFSSGMVKL